MSTIDNCDASFIPGGPRLRAESELHADSWTAQVAQIEGRRFERSEAEQDLRVYRSRGVPVTCRRLAQRWQWSPAEVMAYVNSLGWPHDVRTTGEPSLLSPRTGRAPSVSRVE